jgi:lipoate-protein ligase A
VTAQWYLVIDGTPLSGAHNMAVDYSLLRRARTGVASLRLYGWRPPCLSFGRHEPARTRYDADQIRAMGLDTVRRPTGGRAVWHEHEVTYAVAGPAEMFGSLADAYREIHRALAEALRQLGVAADLAAPPAVPAPHVGAGACFATPAGGEIVVQGRKLVGSAQLREGGAFLQHGSILLENGQGIVASVSHGFANVPAAASLRDTLRRPVAPAEVVAAITDSCRSAWPGTWGRADPTWSDDDLHQFRDPTWTWRC